jgi:heme-degrading monooxygenase HmoA
MGNIVAFISADDGYLTVLNLFETPTMAGQERLLEAMRGIINGADYPGWISSTLHAGVDERGTANYIQWRSVADLEARYAGETFRHETVPLFNELATSISLLRCEAMFSQRHAALNGVTEITTTRDDYTVIIVLGVEPENQKELLETLAQPDEWLMNVPGYRSHTYLRGLDGTFIVNYAQWDDKATYDAYHHRPEQDRPAYVRKGRSIARQVPSEHRDRGRRRAGRAHAGR